MYELWDSATLNMIDCYGSAAQAEASIDETVKLNGLGSITTFVLVQEDRHEESHTIAEGEAILVAVKRLSSEEKASAETRRVG